MKLQHVILSGFSRSGRDEVCNIMKAQIMQQAWRLYIYDRYAAAQHKLSFGRFSVLSCCIALSTNIKHACVENCDVEHPGLQLACSVLDS